MDQRQQTITRIAQAMMGIETLETRLSDDQDFHDLAVWQIKAALEAAYQAGKNAGQNVAHQATQKNGDKPA